MTCSKGDYGWLPQPLCLWVPQHHLEQTSISRLWDSLVLDLVHIHGPSPHSGVSLRRGAW